MKRCILVVITSFSLTSCLPAIFTAAGATTIAAAKTQSLSNTFDDIKISTQIKASFMKNNFRELYAKIKIDVEHSRVLLTGNISDSEEGLKAVELVWDIKGVKEVINEMVVDKNSSHFDLIQYSRDALITTQIQAKVLVTKDIKWINYTIVTSNNIVYIFGLARSSQELETLAEIASKIRGVVKVVSHAKIVDSFDGK